MAPYGTLIPSIERRLAAWQTLQQHLERRQEVRLRPTITISRAFGCEGYPLAEELQRRFEASTGEPWGLYDKALLEEVARDANLSLAFLADLDRRSPVREAFAAFLASRPSRDEAFACVVEHMLRLARLGNAVIVGRGSAIICRQVPNCFHFRLEGCFAFRAESLARRLAIPLASAEQIVLANERARDRFVSDYLGADVRDPLNYDAVFNNERHTVHEIAAAIVAYVRTALRAQRKLAV